jgi:hypothetical protein
MGRVIATEATPHLPAPLAQVANSSIGAARGVASGVVQSAQGALASAVRVSATNAFMHGSHGGDWVAAGISMAGGTRVRAAPAHPVTSTAPEPDPATPAVPSPAGA